MKKDDVDVSERNKVRKERKLLCSVRPPASPLKKEMLANADAVRSGVFAKRSAITALFVFSHVPRPTP